MAKTRATDTHSGTSPDPFTDAASLVSRFGKTAIETSTVLEAFGVSMQKEYASVGKAYVRLWSQFARSCMKMMVDSSVTQLRLVHTTLTRLSEDFLYESLRADKSS